MYCVFSATEIRRYIQRLAPGHQATPHLSPYTYNDVEQCCVHLQKLYNFSIK